MLAFIKNNKLIVNTQVHESEKEDLNNWIDNLRTGALKFKELYDIEGNISGIEFYTIQK